MRDLTKIATVAAVVVFIALIAAGCRGSYDGSLGSGAYHGGNPGLQGYHFSAPADSRITTHLTPQGTGWEYSY